MICIRTNYEIGPGLVFLPGDLDEKFAPWQQPVLDNLELIAAADGRGSSFLMSQIRSGFIQIIPVTHLRGRSLHDAYIIFDDAQNSVRDLPKTIISRAGFGSKMIFTGDTTQIDIPNLPGRSCGLAHVIDKFSNRPGRAHIRLEKGERSELANWAAELL
jgi:PhoH-like ATPase